MTSGNESTHLHSSDFKLGNLGVKFVVVIEPLSAPVAVFWTFTAFPFHETLPTLAGTRTSRSVVVPERRSPVIATVDPLIVAFLTKYGPKTKTLPVLGDRSYFPFPLNPLTRGAQTLGANHALSATHTAVFPNDTFASPAGGFPEITAVPLTILAEMPDAPETEMDLDVVGRTAWIVWFWA